MSDRCVIHGCNNRSDMDAGISTHFSPTIKSERDKWFSEIRTHSPREFQSKRKVCGGCQVHFAEEYFSRAFHMEGCCRGLIPRSIPTILKIEPGKQTTTTLSKPCLILSIKASVLCQP